MNISRLLLAAFITLFSLVSFAKDGGSTVGNGGGGVECVGRPIEFLDIYEAREKYGWIEYVDFDEADKDLAAKVREVLFKVELALPKNHRLTRLLYEEAVLLIASVRLADNLPSSSDFGIVTLPDDCKLVQVALRGTGFLAGSLMVERRFWHSISKRTQALVLIHEAAHSWFSQVEDDLDGSLALRQFIGLLSSSGAFLDSEQAANLKQLVETGEPLFSGGL